MKTKTLEFEHFASKHQLNRKLKNANALEIMSITTNQRMSFFHKCSDENSWYSSCG